MGKRGFPPHPIETHIARGNPSKVSDLELKAKAAPKFPKGSTRCPPFLHPLAMKEWKRIAMHLRKAGLLKVADVPALSAYCQAYALMQEADAKVFSEGITIDGAQGGKIKNPAASVGNDCRRIMLQYAQQFGLTPSARTRLALDNFEEKKRRKGGEDSEAAVLGRLGL